MDSTLVSTLIDHLAQPILAIDDQGHILGLNPAAEQLLPDDAKPLGRLLIDVIPHTEPILAGLHHGDAFRCDIPMTEDETAEISVAPLPGYGWSVIILGYKNKDMNNLLSKVTHDLKAPLASISSFADLVREAGELNQKQLQFLERIKLSAAKMVLQIHQILDMTWIDAGMKLNLAPVNLVELVQTVLDTVEGQAAARHIELVFKKPDDLPTVPADHRHLSDAVMNLISNAIKYSADNKVVTVRIAVEGDEIALSVKDQGFGIALEHLPELFQRFHRIRTAQTKRIEGTGLGLYITRSIVEQHGGRVSVDSAPAIGSTFTIHLPRAIENS